MTTWGRYRYCTTPQDYVAAQDGYSRRFDEVVADFPAKTKCIDDTCMWEVILKVASFKPANG